MSDAQQKLAGLRARIDAIDSSISELLVARMGVIREVAALKAVHWPNNCHIRPGREGQMHQAIAARFEKSGFPPLAALAMWRQLIGASTHLESPLNIVALAAHPEHVWLAREYFGVQIGAHTVANLAEALVHLHAGGSNILILPDPAVSDWWRDADAIRAAGLAVFAALPVVAGNVPAGAVAAVALAAVTPEDSGDDVSYQVEDGAIVIRHGFYPALTNGIFLGAHPSAVILYSHSSL